MRGEAARGQPEVERGIDQGTNVGGIEDATRNRNGSLARGKRLRLERGLMILANQIEYAQPLALGRSTHQGPQDTRASPSSSEYEGRQPSNERARSALRYCRLISCEASLRTSGSSEQSICFKMRLTMPITLI